MSAVTSIRERYPLGVIMVGLISIMRVVTIVAGLTVSKETGILAWVSNNGPLPDVPEGTDVELIVKAMLIGLAAASILTVIGLIFHRRWAWVLAIVTAGAILAIDLGWWFAGEGRYTSMLLNVIAVFYLNQRDVRVALRGEHEQ